MWQPSVSSRGYIGIMEKNMENLGFRVWGLGFLWNKGHPLSRGYSLEFGEFFVDCLSVSVLFPRHRNRTCRIQFPAAEA